MSGAAALVVGLVAAVADGDTLTVLNEDFQHVKVRRAEIDAPGKRQPFGNRARQSLGELCHERRAEARVIDVDRYKRIVGRVNYAGLDANATQVRRGVGHDRYAKDRTLLQAAGRG